MSCASPAPGMLLLGTAVLLACCCIAAAEALPENFAAQLHTRRHSYAAYLDILRNPNLLAGAKTYQQLMQHKHSLSRGSLQRSLVYKGANLRLRRVLKKLLAGEQQVSIGVIGGSISWGHLVRKDVEDWFTLFAGWLNATFPTAKLRLRNGCVPATQSEYVSMCLKHFVDAEVDLVFVEYATNDGYMDSSIENAAVKAFERLLRKLLQHKNAPAVCLMEFLATDAKIKRLPFYATAEDQYGVLAQYYGLPWLSYRNAVWHGLMQDLPGYRRYEMFPAEDERHPTALGHKYMADIAVNLVQQTYVDSLLVPMDVQLLEGHPLAKVPRPTFPNNYESSNLVCIIGDELPSVVVQNNGNWSWVNEGTAAKPKWGYVSWNRGASLVLKVDTRASEHQHDSSTSSTAAGSTAAGSTKMGSKASSHSKTPAGRSATQSMQAGAAGSYPSMIVWVGYLKGSRHMGSATVSCISGCQCQSTSVDAMHGESNTQQHMTRLYTTEAAECLVEVKIDSWARTNEHKFKVTGIMVTRRVDYHSQGGLTDTLLLDSMAQAATPGDSNGSI